MMNRKIAGLLGIAMKAGAVKSGELSCEDAIRHAKAALVLIAVDASQNTKKKFSNMSHFYEVPLYIYGTKEALGQAIGKDWRSVLCICSEAFADSCIGKLREAGEDRVVHESL